MHVLVIGAGVIGLSTAYYLRADGHEVTVVDSQQAGGQAASYANGGQLSYSYVAPLAGPGVLSKIPGWLLRADSPMRFRPSLDPALWHWCLQFAKACNRRQSALTTRRLLTLSRLSQRLMHAFAAEETGVEFDYGQTGKLVLHRDKASFEAACQLLDYQRSLGCEQQALSPEECVRIEPALAAIADQLSGGIHTASEESGDCYRFCQGLEQRLREQGVQFRFGTSVTRLEHGAGNRVRAFAGQNPIPADEIVVASGVAGSQLVRPLGLRLPLYPLKGYSLTLPVADDAASPRVSVTDFQRKVVYARLGRRLRVAGMADLAGRQASVEPGRIATLRAEAAAAFPGAGDFGEAEAWAGLRPATPSGMPILGPTPYRNLWLNLGHGALGFTLALGSGKWLADFLGGRPAEGVEGFLLDEVQAV